MKFAIFHSRSAKLEIIPLVTDFAEVRHCEMSRKQLPVILLQHRTYRIHAEYFMQFAINYAACQ